MPAPGLSYAEASFLHARATERYDDGGDVVAYRRLGDVDRPTTHVDHALVLFAEAGLGHGFALEADAALKRVVVEEPATLFRTTGPADARLLLKRGFRLGRAALAVSAECRAALLYDETEYPALGSGGGDAAVQAHAGFATARAWIQAEGGLRWRGGGPQDEWPFAVQGGVHGGERWSVAVDLRGHGARGGRATVAGAPFDPARVGSRLLMAGPAVSFTPRARLRVSTQAWRSLAGANVPAGWKWKLAVAWVR